MIELLIRIFCDIQPNHTADGVFLFGQTTDNQQSVLLKAHQLLTDSLTSQIMFAQTPAFSGHPGYEAWKKELMQAGIDEKYITGIPIPNTPVLHTLIEAESLINFAKINTYHTLYITASPFHQLRAFMTAVTATLKIDPTIRLYSQTGTSLPWLEEVLHSQGKTKGTRNQLITGELERIEKYQRKGDLASVEAVLAYLNKRDID